MQGHPPSAGRGRPGSGSTADEAPIELPGVGTDIITFAVDSDGDASPIAHNVEDDGALLLPEERRLPADERERLLLARRRPRQTEYRAIRRDPPLFDTAHDDDDTTADTSDDSGAHASGSAAANTSADATASSDATSSSGTGGGSHLEAPVEIEFETLKHSSDAARDYLDARKSETPTALRAEQIKSSSEPTLSPDLRVAERPLDPQSRDPLSQTVAAQQDPRAAAAAAIAAAAVVAAAQHQQEAQQQQQQAVLLNQQNHPDHALYQRALNGVHALDGERLQLTGEQQQNVAAALAVKVREMPGLERAAGSNMTVALSQNADRVFAVDNPNGVAPRHASVEVAVAREQTVTESTRQLAQLPAPDRQSPTQAAPTQTQDPTPPEQPRGPHLGGR